MVKGQKTQTVLSDLCVYVSQDCTGKLPSLHKGFFRFEITNFVVICKVILICGSQFLWIIIKFTGFLGTVV